MTARTILLISALAFFSISATEANASNSAVSKQSTKQSKTQASKSSAVKRAALKRKYGASRHMASSFVPPPPAFQPSILPESYYYRGRSVAVQTDDADDDSPTEIAAKPQNKYAKYFFSREGDIPQTNHSNTRSGVTNW